MIILFKKMKRKRNLSQNIKKIRYEQPSENCEKIKNRGKYFWRSFRKKRVIVNSSVSVET